MLSDIELVNKFIVHANGVPGEVFMAWTNIRAVQGDVQKPSHNNERSENCPWCNGEGFRLSNKRAWLNNPCVVCHGTGKLSPVS